MSSYKTMASTADLVARELNDANLNGIASGEAWSDLVSSYFTSVNDSDEDSTSDEDDDCEDDLPSAADETSGSSDSNSTASSNSESEAPCVVINETAAIVENAGLNLVSDADTTEVSLIQAFQCKCKYNNGLPCYSLFMWECVRSYRLQIHELERHEKDLVILAQIAAHIQRTDQTQSARKKMQGARKQTRVLYFHDGREICRDMFKFLHRYFAIQVHYLSYILPVCYAPPDLVIIIPPFHHHNELWGYSGITLS